MTKFFSILFSAFIIISCSEKPDGSAINITSTGIEDAEIKLYLIAGESDTAVASSMLTDGTSAIDYTLETPQMIALRIEGVVQPIVFYGDVNNMTVDIDGTQTPPSFTITGSVYNDSLEAFGKAEQDFQQYVSSFRAEWENAVAANDSITQFVITTKADSSYKAFESYLLEFAARNGVLGAMIAQRYIYDAGYNELQAIYDNIRVEHRNSPDVEAFKERLDILQNTQIGMRFTDFTQNDTTGAPFNVGSVNGKYILIDFWASWCAPCRQANPDLVAIYDEFHEKGFEIVGVSLDQELGRWKQAIIADDLHWPQMSDLKGWQNEGAASYAIRSIPQSVIIDDQGFIVNKNLDPDQLRAFLTDKL